MASNRKYAGVRVNADMCDKVMRRACLYGTTQTKLVDRLLEFGLGVFDEGGFEMLDVVERLLPEMREEWNLRCQVVRSA